MKSKTKQLLISGVAAAAIFSSLAIPQVRVEANQFLSLFRVNEFEMVKLTQSDIREIENWVSENKEGTLDLMGIGKLEMSETSGEPTFYETYESAVEAGYPVPKLGEFDIERVRVTPASTITFTLNVEKTNQLLTQLGSEHQFEALLNEKPFSVSIFEAIQTEYKLNDQSISYRHTKSPEIKVPEGVSIEQLRATLLSLPFIPENVKSQLAGIDNIETTLPIPLVETEGSIMTEVRVGNAPGFVIESENDSYMVWKENGDIQMLFATGKKTADEFIQLSKQIN
ncbi:hypothetical protein [Bacillus sp. JJ1562]|uniref:hypothetical protein n=1 Tax=Bacillus sp. JJ1562 TaxID=3122960 RepID=UPI00300359EC